jgi:hypothetical protein
MMTADADPFAVNERETFFLKSALRVRFRMLAEAGSWTRLPARG